MRRLLGAGLALALLATPGPAVAAPARMLVTADEWLLVMSRQRVKAGRVQIQLYNRGEDAHDLAIRKLNRLGKPIGRTRRLGETAPGQLAEATWKLRSGQYALWCGLRGHRAAGMRATLQAR